MNIIIIIKILSSTIMIEGGGKGEGGQLSVSQNFVFFSTLFD
jgi:hypothetical protein